MTMDVIISAPQAGGKTRAAMVLATGFLGAESWNVAKSKVLIIRDWATLGGSSKELSRITHVGKYEVIIFDENSLGTENIKRAIQWAADFRRKFPGRSLLAIYCHQAPDAGILFSE